MTSLEPVRAYGTERNGQLWFPAKCPGCGLISKAVFDRRMHHVGGDGCSHFISAHVHPGTGVFLNFSKEA